MSQRHQDPPILIHWCAGAKVLSGVINDYHHLPEHGRYPAADALTRWAAEIVPAVRDAIAK